MELTTEKVKGEKTKYRLAQSMKECMKTTTVDNITVKQITENCGLTRQTFYRNFMSSQHWGRTLCRENKETKFVLKVF